MQECNHDLKHITIRTIKNGTQHYQYQCAICFSAVGNFISTIKAEELINSGAKIEHFNQKSLDNRLELEALEAQSGRYRAKQEFRNKKTAWWGEYKIYLQSAEWADKRNAVLSRAGHICECCGYKEATAVHHLSYKNVGHEYLQELAATCAACHSLAHEEIGCE